MAHKSNVSITYTADHKITFALMPCPNCGHTNHGTAVEVLGHGDVRIVCRCGIDILSIERR
jgi:hypothetical protein